MNYYDVLVASKTKHNQLFTYKSSLKLTEGQIVKVPFRNQFLKGVVVNNSTAYSAAKECIPESNLVIPRPLLTSTLTLARNSGIDLSGVAQLLLSHIETKPVKIEMPGRQTKPVSLPELTHEQQQAIKLIRDNDSKPVLLHGVTGSGKTRVYLELVREQLASGRSCLLLSPEVGLGSQLATEVAKAFPLNTIFTHSSLTPKQRQQVWGNCLASDKPLVIVGPRSSIFLPIRNLGLIVMDEFHDDSYKQDNDPRYHALHAVSLLAKASRATLVCGSASPNVGDYYYFKLASYPIVSMSKKALPAQAARVDIVDMRKEPERLMSKKCLRAIESALEQGNQALVFFNRRGSSRLVACELCDFEERCANCSTALVLHRDKNLLICHTCGYKRQPRSVCPECQNPLRYTVPGIKQLEADIQSALPGAKVVRFDSDTNKRDALYSQLSKLRNKPNTVLVGTQILSKGLDLPLLQTVVVIKSESVLAIPDYRADEKMFQQILQLIGRVGRGHIEHTAVYLQTHNPSNPTIQLAAREDWNGFYQNEIENRRNAKLPPFRYMANIRIRRKTESGVETAALAVAKKIGNIPGIEIIGPAPALIEKHSKYYEWTLQTLSRKRSKLLEVKQVLGSQEYFDLDPTQLF